MLRADHFRRNFSIKRTLVKLAGLYLTLGVLALIYLTVPEYSESFYARFWTVLRIVLPYFLVLSVPYFLVVDALQANPRDGYWYEANLFAFRFKHVNWRVLNQYALGWVIKGIKVVRPLNYLPYTKQEAIEILVDKFRWQPYPQKHFESRFTKFYEGYWLPKKFGYDTRRVQYSSLILTNQMTREDALEKLKSPSYDDLTITREFEYVANKLGISVGELQGYMDAPNKTYRDYKSQKSVYALGATAMRWLGLELGGKR